jgi:hypothetical protein
MCLACLNKSLGDALIPSKATRLSPRARFLEEFKLLLGLPRTSCGVRSSALDRLTKAKSVPTQ